MATIDNGVLDSLIATLFARAMQRAGNALSEMSGGVMSVSAPAVQRCSAADVIDMAGGPDVVSVGIYIGITGSLDGHGLLLLPLAGARRLAALLLGEAGQAGRGPDGSPAVFDEMELSALQELGNVTIGAFLNELATHMHEPVHPTVPQALIEFSGSILDAVLADLALETDDDVLAARTQFLEGDHQVDGTLLVLPRPNTLHALLAAVGLVV